MVVLTAKVKLQTNLCLIVVLFVVMFVLSSNSLHQNTRLINRPTRLGTASVDGPSVLMEGVREQHKHHNKQNNDKEENKSWFAILLQQLLQTNAATCVLNNASAVS